MISCSHYDYIEIVCLYHYAIKLFMKSGEVIEGHALDTQRNGSGQECIKIVDNKIDKLVQLDNIAKLQICIENLHFK
ncbi:Rho-binding antiterminator [Paraglaciecola aquimarina]|uniref:Rho-binding antiterminator n=1 Tax=Paraglaciecola aquimarina TaxID=1235557 RepID=A0ABU3STR1_9ALTE|nr:Rho-binding antiterminator [Paraglaciecola aquimarina]MDU0353395.1 Rho-binding antiterminator [Paraglaciecola aquimarina]